MFESLPCREAEPDEGQQPRRCFRHITRSLRHVHAPTHRARTADIWRARGHNDESERNESESEDTCCLSDEVLERERAREAP